MAKTKKVDYTKLTKEIIDEVVVADISEGTPEFEAAVKYVTEYWEGSLSDKQSAKSLGLTPKEYAMGSIGNGINDGHHLDYMEEPEADAPKGQEIVEVDQDEVKKALKALVTRENDFLSFLYDMHAEYNEKYFYGQLSFPFITIDKLSNKTLGNYTHGEDAMGIKNHIRFNRNFIALNDDVRILETLRHEMIHQWQDEVLYMEEGVAKKKVKMPAGFNKFLDKSEPAKLKWDKDGRPTAIEMEQKSRPKEWHNRDFKEYAVVVDIPAKGDKCYGNPANMPQGKSYNRKFSCRCEASNGAYLTIWSTRPVKAICQVCKSPFIEQEKAGELIPVVLSSVEQPGEDAMEIKAKNKGFQYFEKFRSKKEQGAFVDTLYAADVNGEGLEVEQGFYMKGNNAYKEGFTHWVAYNGVSEVMAKKAKKAPAPKKLKLDNTGTLTITKPSEEPPIAPEPKKADTKEKPKAAPKKKAAAKKKPEPKVDLPKDDVKVELPKEPEVQPEPPKKEKPVKTKAPKSNVVELPTAKPALERTYKNPQDLLAAYKDTGSIKGVAETFGMTPANVIYWAKKLGVDFKKGEIKDVVKA